MVLFFSSQNDLVVVDSFDIPSSDPEVLYYVYDCRIGFTNE